MSKDFLLEVIRRKHAALLVEADLAPIAQVDKSAAVESEPLNESELEKIMYERSGIVSNEK